VQAGSQILLDNAIPSSQRLFLIVDRIPAKRPCFKAAEMPGKYRTSPMILFYNAAYNGNRPEIRVIVCGTLHSTVSPNAAMDTLFAQVLESDSPCQHASATALMTNG
jgi:hypothetical protein